MPISKSQSLTIIPHDYGNSPLSNPPVNNFEKIGSKVNILCHKVFEKKPVLSEILDKFGTLSLYDYEKAKTNHVSPAPQEKLREFIEIMQEETSRLLGPIVGKSVARQLKTNHSMSTTQHFGPLSHGNILNPTLQSALPYFGESDSHFENVITLACAGVSFDNDSFPRGHIFHSSTNQKIERQKFAFFGRSVDSRPVIFHPAYTKEAIESAKKGIYTLYNERVIQKQDGQYLTQEINEIYGTENVLSQKNYVDQISITNYHLWKKIFEDVRHAPNLIFLSQETLVLKLLQKFHINQKTFIHRLIFDKSYLSLVNKHFDGIQGAFSQKNKSGTFLFWALPKGSKYRVQLWYKDGKLTTEDGTYSLPLTPSAIGKAISENELIPSMVITFSLLSFYYGLSLNGGHSQHTYLTQMKSAFQNLARDAKEMEIAQKAESVPTQNMTFRRPFLAFMKGPIGERIEATGTDLLLHKDKNRIGSLSEMAKQITLLDAFYRVLPEFYRQYLKKDEQDEELLQIGAWEIEKIIDYDKKVPPIATLLK